MATIRRRANRHLRDRPSTRFNIGSNIIPDEFCEFVEEEVWPCLKIGGYKQGAKLELATDCVHALITTGLVGRVVADARDGRRSGAKSNRKVWDALVDAGFACICTGSEDSGKVTRYGASRKLLRLREEWELDLLVDLNLKRNTKRKRPTTHALVVLHTGKIDLATGQPLDEDQIKRPLSIRDEIAETWPTRDGVPAEDTIDSGLRYWRCVEDSINAINRENLRHKWAAFDEDGIVFQPNPCLRQIHCGRFFRGARLYSWSQISGQNLSKSTRKRMLIDEERTAELDFSCLHIRMLYHLLQLDPEGDLYKPHEIFPQLWKNASKSERAILRDFLKRATNICLNTRSQGKANSSVGKLMKDHVHRSFWRHACDVERTSAKGIVQRIVDGHPDVADAFFCEAGMLLMGMDGAMMHHILREFVLDRKLPALAIHDALVVRRSDAKAAKRVMAETYQKFCEFPPLISREF